MSGMYPSWLFGLWNIIGDEPEHDEELENILENFDSLDLDLEAALLLEMEE